jgi:SAM-dependent methyltransferase
VTEPGEQATPRFPVPPEALVRRVGWDIHGDPLQVYEQRGRLQWELIKSLLPDDWMSASRRVLDFGCGAGRIVRHALSEHAQLECWACDIDAGSLGWLRRNLSPPLQVAAVGDWPPAPFEDASFDLIYAFSVFTHLLDSWSAWLLELHRMLADDGILIVTVFGPGALVYGHVPIAEDLSGMNVFKPGTPWDDGGPLIVHSEWWLHAHWGRAFEIAIAQRGDPAGGSPLFGQSIVVMRKRPVAVTREELERADAEEPRELAAARENVATLRTEVEELRSENDVYATSHSWKLTAPLRRIAATARRVRGQD